MSGESERELIRRARAGDETAFAQLVAQHAPALYSLASVRLLDSALAAEVVQDVFVRLFHSIGEFRGDAALRTWLTRVTLNRCVDAQRRRARARRFVPFDAVAQRVPDMTENQEASRLRAERHEGVRRALLRLPEPLRVLISMRYDAGLSYAEIARVLEMPLGTVGTRLVQALKRLRRELQDEPST